MPLHDGISVVIPNYNGEALFPETLPTVITALEKSRLVYELIIADDCSTDDSVAFLQKNFPRVKIISTQKNSGFSITSNAGIRSARYNLVLLLNNDVKLEPGYFTHQLAYFDRDDTFGVMGRIIGWDDDRIQDGAKYPSFHNVKIKTSVNYILENEEEMNDGLYSTYVSGANALFDKKKFLALGGFNELFSPFYVEDYELSLRAWRNGWKCYYDHQSVCRHRVSVSIQTKNRKYFIRKIYNRNKMFLHAIHLSNAARILWMGQLVLEILVQTVLFKTYYLKAFMAFLKQTGRIRTSRRKILHAANQKELLSVKEVASFIKSSVKNKRLKFF